MKVALVKPLEKNMGIGAFTKGFYSELEGIDKFRVEDIRSNSNFPILSNSYEIYIQIPSQITEVSQDFDIIFLPSHSLIAGIDPEKLDCEIAVMVHDLEKYPSSKGHVLQKVNRNRSVEKLIGCDYIFAPSESTRIDLLKFTDVDIEKTYVIGEGVEKAEKIDYVDVPDDFLLYVGDTQPRKNTDNLIEAFDEADTGDVHLIMAGRIYENKDLERTQDVISKTNNSDKIHILGEVTAEELRYLYENAIAYVHPAYFEGFGRPPIEAAYHDTPTMVVKGTAPAEYLPKSLKSGPTKKELEENMEELLKNNSEYIEEDTSDLEWSKVKKRFINALGER